MTSQFKQICKKVKNLVNNEKGQGMVEYALLLVLIAVVAIIAVTSIGTHVNTGFTTANSKLGTASGM